jgi:hypothetical protein
VSEGEGMSENVGGPPESERAKRARARCEEVGVEYVDERNPDGSGVRGYRWPAFENGNTWQLRHGATHEATVSPIAEAMIGQLLERRPDLVKYPEAVAAWGRAEARCLLLERFFLERGFLDDDGKATASERLVGQSERLACQLRDSLGLSPRSEADVANAQAEAARSVVDLDALRQRGREALKARRQLESAERLRVESEQVREDE